MILCVFYGPLKRERYYCLSLLQPSVTVWCFCAEQFFLANFDTNRDNSRHTHTHRVAVHTFQLDCFDRAKHVRAQLLITAWYQTKKKHDFSHAQPLCWQLLLYDRSQPPRQPRTSRAYTNCTLIVATIAPAKRIALIRAPLLTGTIATIAGSTPNQTGTIPTSNAFALLEQSSAETARSAGETRSRKMVR